MKMYMPMKLGALKTIWHRKHRWLGHVLRHDNLLHDVIEGKMLARLLVVGKEEFIIA